MNECLVLLCVVVIFFACLSFHLFLLLFTLLHTCNTVLCMSADYWQSHFAFFSPFERKYVFTDIFHSPHQLFPGLAWTSVAPWSSWFTLSLLT